jgi:NAD+ synthase (glutamine-hydrolysing)
MKIALAQINYHIGHFEKNNERVCEAIRKARKANVDLIIFAELAVSGYPPRDFLEFPDFIDRCNDSVQTIAKECVGISAIIGCPTLNPEIKGKNLYNSACFLSDGKIKSLHHKSLLPTYDVFDEYRYFEPNHQFQCAEMGRSKIAVTICEDLWNISDDPLYTICPMDELIKEKPDLIVNIAASPFHYDQADIREKILSANAKKFSLPVFYVNHVGAQTELLFDGGSQVISSSGMVAARLAFFEEDFLIFDLDTFKSKKINEKLKSGISKTKMIHDALAMGIKDYFSKLGFNKAILGLSGGIDSALTMVLAAEALGVKNVHGILLPSQFSSEHSLTDAKTLAENLGCPYDIIPIEEAYKAIEHTLNPYFKDLPFNLTEENIQARLRAVILMALSNKFGYILLNTSNKSEAAVGYGTLYGDMCGGISVLGDVYKTQVYELARYINAEEEVIPENTINKPPSAELRPGQKDSDSLPDYAVLDKILFEYIELRKGPKDLIKLGFDEATVRKVLKMVNTTEYKRYQTPPILRISPKAFGMGRRMPIVAKYLS